MSDTTLSDHLAKARAARDPEKLREHAATIRAKRWPTLKPCNCGKGDGVEWKEHKATCPVYNREKRKR